MMEGVENFAAVGMAVGLLLCLLLLYFDTRGGPESLLTAPAERSWIDRLRDRATTILWPLTLGLAILAFGRDAISEHVAFLQDPLQPSVGGIAGVVLAIGRLLARLL